jgi:hypothetical protein
VTTYHPTMRRVLLVFLVALAGASVALASGGDPKKETNAADQARARAMLLRKADLSAGFHTERNGLGLGTGPSCPALDESGLTITGEATSPGFAFGFVFVSSQSQVYKSVADASTSWRQGVSAAGVSCLRVELRREFSSNGLKLVSLRRQAFPQVAQRTAAYRIVLSGPTQAGTVDFVFDIVGLMYSRAQASVFVGSAIHPDSKAEELRLAHLLSGRMAKAMRGT